MAVGLTDRGAGDGHGDGGPKTGTSRDLDLTDTDRVKMDHCQNGEFHIEFR